MQAYHLQKLTGLSTEIYWLANYTYDLFTYSIVTSICLAICGGFGNAAFVGDATQAQATVLAFFLFGLSVIPLSYLYSLIFEVHTSAQIGVMSLNFVTGFCMVVAYYVMNAVEDMRATNESLKQLWVLFPPFNFGMALTKISTTGLTNKYRGSKQSPLACRDCEPGEKDDECGIRINEISMCARSNLWHMFWEAIALFALLLLIERGCVRRARMWAADLYRARVLPRLLPLLARCGLAAAPGPASTGGGGGDGKLAPEPAATDAGQASLLEGDMLRAVSGGAGPDPNVLRQRKIVDALRASSARSGAGGKTYSVVVQHLTKKFRARARKKKARGGAAGDGGNVGDGDGDGEQSLDEMLRARRKAREGRLRRFASAAASCGRRRKTKVAVDDMCLAIEARSTFGFLGTNGAGKTTTLRVLTGDLRPSAGTASIAGYDIRARMSKARRCLGYCPQVDPLIGLLTAREHLLMLGRLKGISEAALPALAEDLIQRLGLKEYADKPAARYSGGTKRKLSLALAILGFPPVVMLDEPSSGMDPQARRFMHGVIRELAELSCVVLTTHQMDEAEALCSKIGIMARGAFKCVGSRQELKERYGKGYMLELNVPEGSVAATQAWVKEAFPGAFLKEAHWRRLKYALPKQDTVLSEIFEQLEAVRASTSSSSSSDGAGGPRINEYALSSPTLEQIFVAIARESARDEDGESNMVRLV